MTPVKWAKSPLSESTDLLLLLTLPSFFLLPSSFLFPFISFFFVCSRLGAFALNRCPPFSSLDSSPMPTPSDNQPTSIAEVISTRTCPPDPDRISAWRNSPDSTGSAGDALDDILSPSSGSTPFVLSRSDDGGSSLLAPEALKVEQKLAAGTDLDMGRERSVSPTDPCDRGRSSPVMPTPSLMRYEFSNVRVCTKTTPNSFAT